MLLLNKTPAIADIQAPFYESMARLGMVQSSLMRGEKYFQSASFNPEWARPAVTWSSDGRETYSFRDGRAFKLHPTGAMTIAAGDRYSYAAGDSEFFSSMVVFPQHVITASGVNETKLRTRLIRPNRTIESLMTAIARRCRTGDEDHNWYTEKSIELYRKLASVQVEIDNADYGVASTKLQTRIELKRRTDRAQQYILANFDNPQLTVGFIANEACLSKYHMIRIFRSVTGRTPMQYLTAARMTAAHRLLNETDYSISEVALKTGYRDRITFYRAFRRHFSVAPSSIQRNRIV